MQAIKKWSALLLVLLIGSVPVSQAADDGIVFLYQKPSFVVPPEEAPKVERAGEIMLAGVAVPAYSMTMISSGRDEPETFTPKIQTLDKHIKPAAALRLEAYAYPMGIVLVPKGWTPRSANIGADGSMVMLFAPDTSGQSYLLFSHAGACVGCAFSSASLYFPEARTLAQEGKFDFYQPSDSIRTIRLSPFEQAYSIKLSGGNPLDGLAHFDADDDFPFYDVQIRVAASEHALATVILNQFVAPKRSVKH